MRVRYLFFALILTVLVACDRQEPEGRAPIDVKEFVGVKGCPYCHDMRRELLGPSFYEISRKYSVKDRDELVRSLLKGSRGKWGDRAMPPQKLSKEEAELIVDWILSLKDDLN